jgi:hypothetical protein
MDIPPIILIELIGPEGNSVRAFFDPNDHKNVREIQLAPDWLAVPNPQQAYNTLKDNGYKAITEEQHWLDTGLWPD